MGMYTGLRCKIKIKEEYVNALKELENLGKHSRNLGYSIAEMRE